MVEGQPALTGRERIDVALDAPRARQLSVGMQRYVDELPPRLPRIASDLRFGLVPRASALSLAEQVATPWRLWRRAPRMVHHLALYAPVLTRRPYVVTVHDLIHLRFPHQFKAHVGPYYRAVIRRLCARAALVITDDGRTTGDLQRFLGVPREKVRVIPLGVDDRFLRDGIEPERGARPYFLYAGNHRSHKDLPTLFAAWEALPEELEADLWLTGSDDLPAGARRPERPHGALRFLGEVDEARLPSLYAGAIALAYPSLCEGFGLPMLEAAAAGTRVIASADAVPTGLAPYAECFVVRDVRGLRDLLQAAAAGTAPVRKAQAYARSQTWDRCAELTAEVYREVLREGEAP